MSAIDPYDAAIGPDSIEIGLWQQRLIYFHRLAGGFMMLKGLVHWASLFGEIGPAFPDLATEVQAATVFFAVIDLAAGVALWLGSGWGASLWMVAVVSQIVAVMLFLDLSLHMVALTLVEILLVAIYIVIRFKIFMEDDR